MRFSHQSVISSLLGPNILLDIYKLPSVKVWQSVAKPLGLQRLRETDGPARRIIHVSVTHVPEGTSWLSYYSLLIKENHKSRLKRQYKMDTCIQIRNENGEDNTKTRSWEMEEKNELHCGRRSFQSELWGLKSHRKWNHQDEANGAKIGPESTWSPHVSCRLRSRLAYWGRRGPVLPGHEKNQDRHTQQ
jgi:hypothetical protein